MEKKLKETQGALDQATAEAQGHGEELEALKKESQDALDQAKAEALKREEELGGRLRALLGEFSGE